MLNICNLFQITVSPLPASVNVVDVYKSKTLQLFTFSHSDFVYVISIKSLMGLFKTSVSLIQIYAIYVGVYLTASPLQHRLMWWVCDKLLLLYLCGLALFWLYMIRINSTIPVDYCGPKNTVLICRVNWFLFSYTILNKPTTLNLKNPFLKKTQVNQSALVSTSSILKQNILGGYLSWKTLLLSPPFFPPH